MTTEFASTPSLVSTLVDDQLIDPDLADRHQIVLAGFQRLELFLQTLLGALDPLAGDAILLIELGLHLLENLELVADHRAFERRRHRDEFEGALGDDDAIPMPRRRAGQKALALGRYEIGLVGDQDASVG